MSLFGRKTQQAFWENATQQEIWDDQIEMNRSANWREAHQIATKMQKCPNNPRNGGDGYGGTDRRGSFWYYQVDDHSEPKTKSKPRWWDFFR